MNIPDHIEKLCYEHVEKDEPIAQDDLEWLLDTASVLYDRLSEAGLIVAALSVYGERASLPALVRHARTQVALVGDALEGRSVREGRLLASRVQNTDMRES